MKALNLLILACLGLLGDPYSNAQETRPGAKDSKASVKKLLADIVIIEGRQSIESDNSQLVVTTPAIERVVNSGPKSIDLLMLAMKDESISFDAFARCYSACDQILRKIDPELGVIWYGGCEIQKIEGQSRLVPSGQANEQTFRQEVVGDIELKLGYANKKKNG